MSGGQSPRVSNTIENQNDGGMFSLVVSAVLFKFVSQ